MKAEEIGKAIDKFCDDSKKQVKELLIPTLKIRYHRDIFPTLPDVEQHGNFVDAYCAETVMLTKGEFHLLNLGISVECPAGYWMQVAPRSSTFKNWGVIQTNSFGVIDTSYCGDNDIVKMPILATRDICIPANTRICQFRLVKDINFDIATVDKLEGPDRGGFGSTGQYEEK
jgi:dUTP pyrophosphatase